LVVNFSRHEISPESDETATKRLPQSYCGSDGDYICIIIMLPPQKEMNHVVTERTDCWL